MPKFRANSRDGRQGHGRSLVIAPIPQTCAEWRAHTSRSDSAALIRNARVAYSLKDCLGRSSQSARRARHSPMARNVQRGHQQDSQERHRRAKIPSGDYLNISRRGEQRTPTDPDWGVDEGGIDEGGERARIRSSPAAGGGQRRIDPASAQPTNTSQGPVSAKRHPSQGLPRCPIRRAPARRTTRSIRHQASAAMIWTSAFRSTLLPVSQRQPDFIRGSATTTTSS